MNQFRNIINTLLKKEQSQAKFPDEKNKNCDNLEEKGNERRDLRIGSMHKHKIPKAHKFIDSINSAALE